MCPCCKLVVLFFGDGVPPIIVQIGLMTPTVLMLAAVGALFFYKDTVAERFFFMQIDLESCLHRRIVLMIQKIGLLAAAGALGTLARYGLSGYVNRINGSSFPFGTMTVNLAGCFLAGLIWAIFEHRFPVSAEIKTIVLIGFMGAFTTFSTLILESNHLMNSSEWVSAATNLTVQNGLGIVVLFVGIAIGKSI